MCEILICASWCSIPSRLRNPRVHASPGLLTLVNVKLSIYIGASIWRSTDVHWLKGPHIRMKASKGYSPGLQHGVFWQRGAGDLWLWAPVQYRQEGNTYTGESLLFPRVLHLQLVSAISQGTCDFFGLVGDIFIIAPCPGAFRCMSDRQTYPRMARQTSLKKISTLNAIVRRWRRFRA